ncbi:MAG: hypothetical protein ACLFUC_00475 [Bacteroidales bacterium]
MKKVLGLDLGTNSIGWALIEQDFDNKKGNILGIGTRIIPMSKDVIGLEMMNKNIKALKQGQKP